MNRRVIGLDLGGTKLSAAMCEGARLGAPRVVPTEKGSSQALIDQIVGAIQALNDGNVEAVGLGIPSVVDWSTGTARSSVNIPMQGVPLREVLNRRTGLPVFVDNDATCAALAEAYDGDRLVHPNLVMFTVGTGVGGGLVLGGKVYRGCTGAAAELGHTIVGMELEDGAPRPSPRFPQHGSLETLAAGTALDRLGQRAAEQEPNSALGRLVAEERRAVKGADVVKAAEAGDAIAKRCMRILGERLGVGIASAINTFDPEVVAIGGGASRAGDLLLEPARETARRFVLPGVGTRTDIRLARHGVQAGLLGAALMAGHELELEVTVP